MSVSKIKQKLDEKQMNDISKNVKMLTFCRPYMPHGTKQLRNR